MPVTSQIRIGEVIQICNAKVTPCPRTLDLAGQCRHMSRQAEDTLWCCITGSRLVSPAGLTVVGSAYNLLAIRTWLAEHATDPLTGVYLPSTHVLKYHFASPARLKRKCKSLRTQTEVWCPGVMRPPLMLPYVRAALEVLSPTLASTPEFCAYSERLFAELRAGTDLDGMAAVRYETLERLNVSAAVFPADCLFVGVTLTPAAARGTLFKGVSLSGATVTGTFINVDFCRTKWVGCTFVDADFIGCRFLGEEVTFLGSSAVRSFACTTNNYVEEGCTWRRAVDEVAEFRRRGLLI